MSWAANALDLAGLDLSREALGDLADATSGSWSMVGKVLVLENQVFIPLNDMAIYADAAVIDLESNDAEITGNIRCYRIKRSKIVVPVDTLIQLRRNPEVSVNILGYITDPIGGQMVECMVYSRGDMIRASRMAGNLNTGVFELNDVELAFRNFYGRANYGIRKPGGAITLEGAEVTTCNYLLDHNEHYSIRAGRIELSPHDTATFGIRGDETDFGEYSFWAYNVRLNIYGAPILWLPAMYKPKDESPGFFQFQIGDNSRWGFHMLFSKKFHVLDNPRSSVRVLADWYTMRGFGYGAKANITAPDSRTEIFGYGIYDIRPYYSSDVQDSGRLKIHKQRYNFRINNVSHITPRLDFRGQFELLSDAYFLNDFYRARFSNNPEPASYAALEYQFNRLSTALYVRPRVNDFFNTVERLPQFRIDAPRQQVFGSNLYYQSESSIDYLRMRWREFDRRPRPGEQDPENYEAFRFDTMQAFYLPFKVWNINIIPRAAGRFTVYSNSSDTKVSSEDLGAMIFSSNPEGYSRLSYNQYDDNGGGRARFIGEFGVEANTKFSRAWQDVRNAFFRVDGLRHVMEPYANYTFIPDPSVNRKWLYYFDDIDRIEKQSFFRLGLRNRLQTRRGGFNNSQIYDIIRMENYWDIHTQPQDGHNIIGDFVTKLEFTPGNGFTFDTLLAIDAGGNNDHDAQAVRRGREAGRPGIGGNLINRWEMNLRYELFTNCSVTVGYRYNDAYSSRSAYSMASTLTGHKNGSNFDDFYSERSQKLYFGVALPLSRDNSFRGAYDIFYDFEEGFIREQRVRLIKTLHCWEVAGEFGVEREYNSDGKSEYNYSFGITAYLTGLLGPERQAQRSVVNNLRSLQDDDNDFY